MPSQHTLGPWGCHYVMKQGVRTGAAVVDSENWVIASLPAGTRDAPEIDANARLMAKAPQMYDLLKRLVKGLSAEDVVKGTFRGVAGKIAAEAQEIFDELDDD